jgi:hypothetical protein
LALGYFSASANLASLHLAVANACLLCASCGGQFLPAQKIIFVFWVYNKFGQASQEPGLILVVQPNYTAENTCRKYANMNVMESKTFEALVQQEGSFTFVALPFSPRAIWGAQPRYYVTGTINGNQVRGTLGSLGQDYFLRLSKAWLRESGLELGVKVTVNLSLEERHA